MTLFLCVFCVPARRNRLHRGAAGDKALIAPGDMNLTEITLEDCLFNFNRPHVSFPQRPFLRKPQVNRAHRDGHLGAGRAPSSTTRLGSHRQRFLQVMCDG
jgi:hypothetical protein